MIRIINYLEYKNPVFVRNAKRISLYALLQQEAVLIRITRQILLYVPQVPTIHCRDFIA